MKISGMIAIVIGVLLATVNTAKAEVDYIEYLDNAIAGKSVNLEVMNLRPDPDHTCCSQSDFLKIDPPRSNDTHWQETYSCYQDYVYYMGVMQNSLLLACAEHCSGSECPTGMYDCTCMRYVFTHYFMPPTSITFEHEANNAWNAYIACLETSNP